MTDFIPVCEPYLGGNEEKYIADAVKTGWISSAGKYVTEFEKMFADFCGAKYAVSTCNGTSALHLALVALGIGKGDEVIIPSFTMVASAFSVCYTGAIPVFVDSDPCSWNLDVSKIEEKITSKTKAIMPVHVFGLPCEMNEIYRLAKHYDLKVLEDAAEAHGATYNNKKVGSTSDITAFSFFANKNITIGEGGMIVTNSKYLHEQCKYYKNLCFSLNNNRNYLHKDIGFNYRLSNLHAAIGVAQMEKANDYINMRINNHHNYKSYLKNVPGIHFQNEFNDRKNVYWMNAITIDTQSYGKNRDQLIQYLKENNVDSRLLFNGMHRQESLKKYGCRYDKLYPNCDYLSDNGLYLPSSSGLTEIQIEYICNLITEFQEL
tara:strand:+ start:1538 stop:2665 length:1128 start_codon:yes stop_codon:yes gene_type:complete